MRHHSISFTCLSFLCLSLLAPNALLAQSPAAETAARFLPATTGIYVEIPAPAAFVQQLQDHPLRKRIEALPQIASYLGSADYTKQRGIVAYLELQLGSKWEKAIEHIAGNGLYFAADPVTEGMVLLAHATDRKAAQDALGLLIETVRGEATKNKQPDPIEVGDYRGQKAIKIDKAYFALVEDWLVVTESSALGQAIIDRMLDGGDSLASAAKFSGPARMKMKDRSAWGYVDLVAVQEAGLAKGLFMEKLDNPVAELLLGGIQSTLQKTPFTTMNLKLDNDGLALVAAMPNRPAWLSEARRFHEPEGAGKAPALAAPAGTILQMNMARDFQAWWLGAEELYTERAFAKFQEADANLANLFGGKNIGTDILNLVGDDAQVIVSLLDDAQRGDVKPEIQLPGIAIAFHMENPANTGRQLKNSFNNLIGFLNIIGAQEERPQFELDMDIVSGGKMYYAAPAPTPGMKMKNASVEYNFAPGLALKGDMAILASHHALAAQLAAGVTSGKVKAGPMSMKISGSNLRQILNHNRTQMVVNDMLEKGHDRKEAEQNIDSLMLMLGAIKSMTMDTVSSDTLYRIDAHLTFDN